MTCCMLHLKEKYVAKPFSQCLNAKQYATTKFGGHQQRWIDKQRAITGICLGMYMKVW